MEEAMTIEQMISIAEQVYAHKHNPNETTREVMRKLGIPINLGNAQWTLLCQTGAGVLLYQELRGMK